MFPLVMKNSQNSQTDCQKFDLQHTQKYSVLKMWNSRCIYFSTKKLLMASYSRKQTGFRIRSSWIQILVC